MKAPNHLSILIFVALVSCCGCVATGTESELEINLARDNMLSIPRFPIGEWHYVEIDGAQTRQGKPTGISIRYGRFPKLMIYLEQGGGCFNSVSCAENALSVIVNDPKDLKIPKDNGEHGIFADRPDNPVAGWNAVFIPYRTGDIYAGGKRDVRVGGAKQQFVGHHNMRLFLQHIHATFSNIDQVLLAGASAGGFGSLFNYDLAMQIFEPIPVYLLDDAGPPLADAYMPRCLQQHWRNVWGLDETLPSDCHECRSPNGGGLVNYLDFLKNKYPNAHLGFISTTHDISTRIFYSVGFDDCRALKGLPPIHQQERAKKNLEEGLTDFRQNYIEPYGWQSYFSGGERHTFTGDESMYESVHEQVRLVEWIQRLLGPASL